MSAIGTKLSRTSGIDKRLMHWCPGCNEAHGIRIEGGSPVWTFNGDFDKPTFDPSVRVFVTHVFDDDDNRLPAPIEETLCHYFIRNGKIDFCGDSPHALAGKQVDLPDWPYGKGTYGGIED